MLRDRYLDLIEQTFYWPALDFNLDDNNELLFHRIPLMDIIRQYGTPARITYLPKIGSQIRKARQVFKEAMQKFDYQGKYTYCYCTKSSHFAFVLNEVLKNNAELETSSAYDMHIIKHLYHQQKITKDSLIICNGYKTQDYVNQIVAFINQGFHRTIPILDHKDELEAYTSQINQPFDVGIRIAAEEEPNFEFYTSRLGIRVKDIVNYYKTKIQDNPNVRLKMLHFFINTGIKDTAYYWTELVKCINVYCALKKICPELSGLDIGGGFPIPTSLSFDYDYKYMVEQIIGYIVNICDENKVPVPDLYTEFGSYTVAESGATIFKVLGQKLQNDAELWYMIDNSFITALPDTWGMNQRFVLMAINNWINKYRRVNLGGLTCDSLDYYNSEVHVNQVFLPRIEKEQTQYIGFFNTGAYQESLGGYGGTKHCLIPSPQHIIIDHKEDGTLTHRLFAEKQSAESMLKVLGY